MKGVHTEQKNARRPIIGNEGSLGKNKKKMKIRLLVLESNPGSILPFPEVEGSASRLSTVATSCSLFDIGTFVIAGLR